MSMNVVSYPGCYGVAAYNNVQNSTAKFMQDTMNDITLKQIELKCAVLQDKINAKDTTPEQRNALVREYNATQAEYSRMKIMHGVG